MYLKTYAGAIAGAFYGHEVINKNLLKHCEGSDKVMEIADKLCSLSSAVSWVMKDIVCYI